MSTQYVLNMQNIILKKIVAKREHTDRSEKWYWIAYQGEKKKTGSYKNKQKNRVLQYHLAWSISKWTRTRGHQLQHIMSTHVLK